MKPMIPMAVALAAFLGFLLPAGAQDQTPVSAEEMPLRSADELDQLLGPIALYPDPLIAEILPASTQPSQIVLADRYVSEGGDPNLIDQQPWDPSVQALARFPELLKWMDDNLAWTTQLGQAFTYQQQDVMDAIQRLRSRAMAMNNLQSTPQQQVLVENGIIEILPTDSGEIYAPVYPTDEVYSESPSSPGLFISFGAGCRIGAWLNCDLDWFHHEVVVWGHDRPRPVDWWRHPHSPNDYTPGNHTVWHPRTRPVVSEPNHAEDRGYENAVHSSVVAVVGRSISSSSAPRRLPAVPSRPQTGARPSNNTRAQGALIGGQSANDARAYSNRGAQSRQGTRSSAPARSAPPSRPAGGGSSDSGQHKH